MVALIIPIPNTSCMRELYNLCSLFDVPTRSCRKTWEPRRACESGVSSKSCFKGLGVETIGKHEGSKGLKDHHGTSLHNVHHFPTSHVLHHPELLERKGIDLKA